uniref:Complexin 4c n=1 Tax=Anabas testudineus TaxID=64144 RepID=A0A7N6BXX2_ANATE
MAFLMNQMLGDKLKSFTGGGEDSGKTEAVGKETAESKGMSREEFEEYQRQLVEEKIQRDKDFAIRKAERANLRVALRDKYRLPDNEVCTTFQMAGDDIDLPEELAKMVDEDEEEEETNDSFLKKLQNLDVDTLKTKAQATVTEIKQTAEDKCTLM